MPNKVMFYFEDQTWTFKQIDEYSNKVANYFSSLNYSKNDTIALFMENRWIYYKIPTNINCPYQLTKKWEIILLILRNGYNLQKKIDVEFIFTLDFAQILT